jgi:hypothetical protein
LVQSRLGGGTLRSLDDPGTLAAAFADPLSLVELGPRPLVIDEVQRVGEPLVRAIKLAVDRDPSSGLFVLTGSSRTAKPEWFRWLTQMRDRLGSKFVVGIALYAGNAVLPFGDRLLAAPISALWEL